MATNIRVSLYQGDRIELLPPICMFCGRSVPEEQFQPFQAQVGGAIHKLAVPVCLMCKLPDDVLQPDGNTAPIAGLNPPRYQPYLLATFTFPNVQDKFAQELDRLRNIRHDLYDPQVAQSNARIQAAMQGPSEADTADAEQRRHELELTEAEDEAAFQLEQAAGTGDVTRATTKESSRKLIWISVIAGAIGLLLVSCITVGIVAFQMYGRTDGAKNLEKSKSPPPKERRAKIKLIDKNAGTIKVLGIEGKHQTFRVDDKTEFKDSDGSLLLQGLNDAKIHEGEYCVLLPTPDGSGLQWLKLSAAPKGK